LIFDYNIYDYKFLLYDDDGDMDYIDLGNNMRVDNLLFINPSALDFHLQSTSPAIDAGTNIALVTKDFDGNLRPMDGNSDGTAEYDIGAYEYTGTYIPPSDTIPPFRSNPQPSGTLASGTTSTTLTLTTNEAATCRYSTTSNRPYTSMAIPFLTTDSVSHSAIVTGLSDGQAYNYYVKCNDSNGNINTDDFTISFSIASPTPTACILTNAYWNTNQTSQGNLVTLTVEGNSYCNSNLINFEIFEQDPLSSEQALINPSSALFMSGRATATWTAEWQCDGSVLGMCTLGNPEYYFNAILNSNSSINIQSDLLEVSKLTVISDNDKDSIPDDLDCNDNNSSIGICKGCAVCSESSAGINSGNCIANSNSCKNIKCPEFGICGAKSLTGGLSCSDNEMAYFPEYLESSCNLENINTGVCTPSMCEPTSCVSSAGCLSDSDSDGVPDAHDFCNTPNSSSIEVNKYGFPKPIMTKFENYVDDELVTNLSYKNLNNLSNFTIGVSGAGKIDFGSEKIKLFRMLNSSGVCEPLDFDSYVNISLGKIEINSENLQELNKSAVVTLYNVSLNNPYITRDGERCNDCSIISYSNGVLVFRVPYFSSYGVEVGEKRKINYFVFGLVSLLIVGNS